ncbi:type III polyketide synthase [Microbacterium sp. X-17]|uniref:type III polyketide synthase n=1 Tax=Microbacterium sp. X-17 TaxID=3144404 RepID=UPI0031F567C3
MPAAPSVVAIGTVVPPTRLAQEWIRDLFDAQPELDRLARRLVHAAFDGAAIEHRHTVLRDLAPDRRGPDDLPVRTADGILLSPSTAARNAEYRRLAPALFAEAARRALAEADVPAPAVTHLITVSCTGLFAPGPDALLVGDLGLDPGVERYHLGFVGCAAAMPALRLAQRLVRAEPEAIVLVVCAELCSLHLRVSPDPEQIVASSLFADGAAAAIVRDAPTDAASLELADFGTALVAEGEAEMTWTVGDHGFEMVLTAEVPKIVGREVRAAAARLLGADAWAVHPGGRSILDRVAGALDLDEAAMAPSRRVLREYGNMSSATILFILRDLLADATLPDGATIGALAFGPGLTVESARLRHRAGTAA